MAQAGSFNCGVLYKVASPANPKEEETRLTVVHLVTSSIFPQPGGLELSVLRIAKSLARSEDFRVAVYTRRQAEAFSGAHPAHKDLEIVHLGREKSFLMEPLGGGPMPSNERIPSAHLLEGMRMDFLLLRSAVEARMDAAPDAKHVLISFFATSNGFVAQQVALELSLPHIASFRGSDFSRDFRSPHHLPAIRFVVENAARVVTTNHEQARVIAAAFPGVCSVVTIHNATEQAAAAPMWAANPVHDVVRLAADCEFSFKKATQVLLRAVAELLDQGVRVSLTVAGRVVAPENSYEESYWHDCKRHYASRFPGAFCFPGWLRPEQWNALLMDSHVYVSATLGEGCSLGQSRALTLGIPMVVTRTGALPQLRRDASHVRLCAPGSVSAFTAELRSMIQDLRRGSIQVDRNHVDAWRRHFDPERERAEWLRVIAEI